MKVEIWSDVVCPWCYIGKRRFEAALSRFAHADQVQVVWHSFELDPTAPERQHGHPADRLAAKYGMPRERAVESMAHLTQVAAEEGLDFHLETAQSGNTFAAHRLIHLGAELGIQDAVKERLLAGYLTENAPIGERDALLRLGAEAGIPVEQAAEALAGDAFAAEVRQDEAEAAALGISGVPFFVFDRTYAVSGAQPADALLAALDQAWEHSHPLTVLTPAPGEATASCDGDNCAL